VHPALTLVGRLSDLELVKESLKDLLPLHDKIGDIVIFRGMLA